MTRDRTLLNDFAEAGDQPYWDWSLLSVQKEFLESTAKFTMFSGGFGTGKTTALCAKVILLLFIPNNVGYLGRLDGKALRASTMECLYEMLPKGYLAKHNDQRGFLQLKATFGGGRLAYGDFKDLNDLKNIPLGFFAIDQAEEVSSRIWDYLDGRLRRKNPVLRGGKRQYWVMGTCPKRNGDRHYAVHEEQKCLLCYADLPPFSEVGATVETPAPWDIICYANYGFGVCNPEGPSHWIYKSFPGLPGPFGTSTTPLPGYEGFHATVYDGLMSGFVKSDYVRDLEHRYRAIPLMWDRYLLGKWVEAEGLVYPTWDTQLQVIHRHQPGYDGSPLIDTDAEMYEVIDHGLTAPTAVMWVVPQLCQCGCRQLNYFIIDGHYEREKPVSYHTTCMKQHRERLPYRLIATYLDSQAFSRTLLGQKGTPRADSIYSVADEYGDYGIHPVPNQKDWDAGYNRINELCVKDPNHTHPITGEKGAPHLFVFSHVTDFIYEMENYKWKKARPNAPSGYAPNEPQDTDDHYLDALNGFLTSRPGETFSFVEAEIEDDSYLPPLYPSLMKQSHMAL